MTRLQLFSDLRSLAANRRDKAIEEARKQYEQSIQNIAALEHSLAPPRRAVRPPTSRSKPLIDLITECLPTDRTFTLDDVYGIVKQADPSRIVGKATVRTNLHRLLKLSVIKRITTAEGNQRSTFAVTSMPVERQKTMEEYALQVLNQVDEKLEPQALLVRMLGAGYKTDCTPKQAINSIRRLLRRIGA